MADFTGITINNVRYSVKDPVARAGMGQDKMNILIIGDSYATGDQQGTGQTTNPTWSGYLKTMLGLDDDHYHVSAVSGSSFLNGYTFGNQLTAAAQNIDANEITHILIAGGYNDEGYTVSGIYGAMQAAAQIIKTTYPNAKTYLACIGWCKHDLTRNKVSSVVWTAYKRCADFGWIFLKGAEYIMHNYRLFCADGFHPNQDGQQALGRGIFEALTTGACSPYYTFTSSLAVTANTDLFDAGTFNAISGFCNGQVIEGLRHGSVKITGGTIDIKNYSVTGEPILLGVINDPYCHMGNYYYEYNSMELPIWIQYDNGTKWANIDATIAFITDEDTDKVKVCLYPFAHGKGATMNDSFDDVDIIVWDGFTLTTNADIS